MARSENAGQSEYVVNRGVGGRGLVSGQKIKERSSDHNVDPELPLLGVTFMDSPDLVVVEATATTR